MRLNLRVDWKKFFLLFALIQCALLLSGCGTAWLDAVNNLLPALETAVAAVISFILALQGKTVPPDTAAAIKKIGDAITAEIENVKKIIAQYQASKDSGLLSQISAAMSAVVQNITQILTPAGVTDSSTLLKISQFVTLIISAAQSIISLIPVVVSSLEKAKADVKTKEASVAKKEMEDAEKTLVLGVNMTTKVFKDDYVAIRAQHTLNDDVNKALDAMPPAV